MRSSKAIVIALALAVGAAVPAKSQEGWHRGGDRDGDAYNRNLGWHDRDGDHDRDDRDQYRYAVMTARQMGFRDGVNDGDRDRDTGHSFRPTHDRNYKHGDHGFDRSFGSRNEYRDWYRQAYLSGYERGYNQRRDRDGGYDRR
jgi:hypothetical protein